MTKAFGKLILTVPDGQEQVFILNQPVTTLGSADSNDIVIRQARVSRAHARIECSESGCTIIDLDSTKGTIVNNRNVKQTNLTSNDLIQLGQAVLRFESLEVTTRSDSTVFEQVVLDTGEAEPPPAATDKGEPKPVVDALKTLIEVQPGAARPPFFFVVARYLDVPLLGQLAKHLGPDQPFYALQPPKPANGPPPFTTIEALTDHYIDTIRDVQANGPYQLGGFNIGGIVAFEVAQQLRSFGDDVSLLALLDTPYFWGNPLPYWNYRFAQSINEVNNVLSRPMQKLVPSNAAQLIENSIQTVKDTLDSRFPRILGRLAEDYETYQTTLTDPAYETNLKAIKSYEPQTYAGRVILFLATESPVRFSGAMWGWHQVIPYGLDIRRVDGSHISILKEPDVQPLAEQLKVCLAT